MSPVIAFIAVRHCGISIERPGFALVMNYSVELLLPFRAEASEIIGRQRLGGYIGRSSATTGPVG